MDIRFWIVAPVAAVVLALFGLYFWGLRKFGHTFLRYPWALTVGLSMGVGNILWNMIASFVFLRLPVWRNEAGGFSPFFTTRLKSYRREGYAPRLVNYLIGAIQRFDPDHFGDA